MLLQLRQGCQGKNGVGGWVLGIGYWVLGIGYWVLGIGCELRVIGPSAVIRLSLGLRPSLIVIRLSFGGHWSFGCAAIR